MTPIDDFEAAHMNDQQLAHECWERDFTYEDYHTQCELLKREAMSKETFRTLYKQFDEKMAASIARRGPDVMVEKHHWYNLHQYRPRP